MLINGIEHDLELGLDHWLSFTVWKPDRDVNPQYADLPDNDRIGAIISHKKQDGSWCQGTMWFDCEQVRKAFPGHHTWTVVSFDPLTCSPSFLCHCGDHGFIRDGKWVTA
jgi:hypothetical protein